MVTLAPPWANTSGQLLVTRYPGIQKLCNPEVYTVPGGAGTDKTR